MTCFSETPIFFFLLLMGSESVEQSETVGFLFTVVCLQICTYLTFRSRVPGKVHSSISLPSRKQTDRQMMFLTGKRERDFRFSFTVADRAKKKHQHGSLKETHLLPVSIKISSDANHTPLGVGALAGYEYRPHCCRSVQLCYLKAYMLVTDGMPSAIRQI